MGFMTSLTTYISVATFSNWCICSPQGRCDYWYTHKVPWL